MAEEPTERSLMTGGTFVSRPVPDPTELTTKLVGQATDALREIIETRLIGMDKALTLLESTTARRVDQAVVEVKELYAEKFRSMESTIKSLKESVNDRFTLGDAQTEKAARDVKSAVDAAFAAAKEAVGEQNKSNALSIAKSEVAFTKQIDQLAESVKLIVKNTDDKFGDLKDRIVAIEGRTSISDPTTSMALRDMSNSIGSLRSGADMGAGQSKGGSDVIVWIFGGIGALWGLGSTLALLFHLGR